MSERTVEAGELVTTGQLCYAIAEKLGGWHESNDGDSRYREGIWTRWPYIFTFKEFEDHSLLGSKYQLLSLSVPVTETGLCEYRAFLIGDDGDVLAALHHDLAEGPDDESLEQLSDAFGFAIEYGLAAPNEDDELVLWSELARGYLDGVEAV